MESAGVPGKVQVSSTTREALLATGKFDFVSHGTIQLKTGEVECFLVEPNPGVSIRTLARLNVDDSNVWNPTSNILMQFKSSHKGIANK